MKKNAVEVVGEVCDPKKFDKHNPIQHDHLFTKLQEVAPISPVADIINPDHLYAVLNIGDPSCWFRATVAKCCGIFQVGDGQAEPLYECFLVDVGHHERIPKSNIRVIPNDLMEMDAGSSSMILPESRLNQPHRETSGEALIQPLISNENSMANLPIASAETASDDLHIKKFKPKFGSWELDCKPIEHASVLITEITTPDYVYVQIQDEDTPFYHQLIKELNEEFCSSTPQSESYCSSPVVGHAYAALLGDHWCRVLVETTEFGVIRAFNIDSGHRSMIKPDMMFHELPERFMKLPAQGIRCFLKGVIPPRNLDGTFEPDFPDEIYAYLRRFVQKQAVAFISEWNVGQVGYSPSSSSGEFSAVITLYPKDDPNSINLQVGRSSLARLQGESLQLPEHFRVIRRLTLDRNHSSHQPIPSAVTQLPEPENPNNMDYLEDSSDSDSSIGSFNDFAHRSSSPVQSTTPRKYKPKFSRSELICSPLKYAEVFIVRAVQPRAIYITIDDDDLPRYHQLHRDLQLEFQSANRQSPSYCPSPRIGHPYAYRIGTQWHRVLIEKSKNRAEVFCVDLGYRFDINPTMMFYKLPDRFMELEAQAVRCSLLGVYPPRNPNTFDDRFPSEIFEIMPTKYDEKEAVAFFDHWLVGEVGNVGIKQQTSRECVAIAALYLKEESESINHQICKTSLAAFRLNRRDSFPRHSKILEKLNKNSRPAVASVSQNAAQSIIQNDEEKEEDDIDGSSCTSVYESAESEIENDSFDSIVPVPLPRKLSAAEERVRFFDMLQDVVPTCPVPDSVIAGQVYIVLVGLFKKWYRATIGPPCGTHQVGDGPSEPLYKCFLLDVVVDDRVPKSSIRVLPIDLMEHPPFAPKRQISIQTITDSPSTKSSSPEISLDVPANTNKPNEEQNHVASIAPLLRSSLSSSDESLAVTAKKFKPKFSRLDLKFNPIHYASVIITKALQPRAVYIQISDDEATLFRRMMFELQQEFDSATPQSDSFCSSPLVGHPYAALFGDQWCRVLIEKVNNKMEVFFVDIGHRQPFHPSMMLFNLPERFMELPAQAIRCSLRGVSPPKNAKGATFPQQIYNYMASRFNGKEAAAFFDQWQEGHVGTQGDSSTSRELIAFVVLYLNETVPRTSINTEICWTPMARQTLRKIDRSMHSDIRRRLKTLPAHLLQCSLVEALRYPATIPEPTPSPEVPIYDDVHEEEVAITRRIEEEFHLPVTFVGLQSPYSLFFRTPELVKKFLRMQSGLNTYFQAQKESTTMEMDYLEVGFIGAVYHEENWFRAKVIGVDRYPEIMVSLLDTSCLRCVNASEIRRLPDGFDQVQKTVLHCSLSGICPLSASAWNPEVTQCITKRLNEEERIMIGCQNNPKKLGGKILLVTVYLPKQVRGEMMYTNLNKELVYHGLAVTEMSNIC